MTGTEARRVPRIRFVKPETFDDPDLCDLPPLARWLFVGLWTQADREGRMEDDPRRVKTRLLPADAVNPDEVLNLLAPKFITRYAVNGKRFLEINNFAKHQRPHPKEAQSVIPAPVKRNGKPLKARASKPDSGVLILDSGVLSLDSGVRGEPLVPSSADADFDAFWTPYPVKVGKKAALKAWAKIKPDESLLGTIVAALETQKHTKAQLKARGEFAPAWPNPSTWLNGRRWEDEVDAPRPTVGSPDYYTATDWRKECAEMGHSPACPSPAWHQVQCDKAKGAA